MNDEDQADVTDALARLNSVDESKKQQTFMEQAGATAQAAGDNVGQWLNNLPKNITVGMIDAAVNTATAAKELATSAAKNFTEAGGAAAAANEMATGDKQNRTPADKRDAWAGVGTNAKGSDPQNEFSPVMKQIAQEYPVLGKHLSKFRIQRGENKSGNDGRQLEYYPPNESWNPNPGYSTIELYRKDAKGDELKNLIAGEVTHLVGGTDPNGEAYDPEYMKLKQQLIASRTPEQDENDKKIWEEHFKDQMTYSQYIKQSRSDEYVMGYLFPDAKDEWSKFYTKDQKAILEQMRTHLQQPQTDEHLDGFGQAIQLVRAVREKMAHDNTTSDDVTQAISQFTIPFLGWSKLLGGASGASKLMKVGGMVGAEGVTAASAMDPHDGRTADLIALGKHTEGKLGEALNALSPDGSLQNAYIDYMTDRNETRSEGRFKNIVDSYVATAAFAGLVKGAATSIKVARKLPEYVVGNAGSGRVGRSAQEGKIVFHGTPHKFDEFSTDKIGTGEGNQTFGHGLYFAENKDIAGQYAAKLGKMPPEEVKRAKQFLKDNGIDPDNDYGYSNPRDYVALARSKGFKPKTDAQVYHVDISDEHIDNMLDYDSDLSAQPNIVKKIPAKDKAALEKYWDENDSNATGALEDLSGNEFRQLVEKAIRDDAIDFTPRDGNFDNAKKNASEYLDDLGIPGIKYLDGSSRKAGEGTRNIVLFNAKHAKIVKKE